MLKIIINSRLDNALKRVKSSGVLGNSKKLIWLLDYLASISREGQVTTELDIAREVFSKGKDFDPALDSTVRVNLHNLRKKLADYYANAGQHDPHRLIIPRSRYALELEHQRVNSLLPLFHARLKANPIQFKRAGLTLVAIFTLSLLALTEFF